MENIQLLGTHNTHGLKWDKNTSEIIKKVNGRLQLLRKASEYTSVIEDLEVIYNSYILSILEQSSVIWGSSITDENDNDLERVQKNALRIIFKENYKSYEQSLEEINMVSLKERREKQALKFANNCLKKEQTKDLFKLRITEHPMRIRNQLKYEEIKSNTERMRKSTVPYLQSLLNRVQK